MTNGWALADDIHILNSYIAEAVEFDYNASLVGVNAWDQIYVNDLWGQMDVSTLNSLLVLPTVADIIAVI